MQDAETRSISSSGCLMYAVNWGQIAVASQQPHFCSVALCHVLLNMKLSLFPGSKQSTIVCCLADSESLQFSFELRSHGSSTRQCWSHIANLEEACRGNRARKPHWKLSSPFRLLRVHRTVIRSTVYNSLRLGIIIAGWNGFGGVYKWIVRRVFWFWPLFQCYSVNIFHKGRNRFISRVLINYFFSRFQWFCAIYQYVVMGKWTSPRFSLHLFRLSFSVIRVPINLCETRPDLCERRLRKGRVRSLFV